MITMPRLDRRRFLTLATAATLSPNLFAEPLGLPAGLQLYAVREPLAQDPAGTLKTLHGIGFREVETAGFGKHTAKEFSQYITDAGLICPSAHLPFVDVTDLSPVFADANALGAKYAVSSSLHPFFGPAVTPGKPINELAPPPPVGLDGFKKIGARMNEIGRGAKAAGLQYAYHNHNFEFERMPDGAFGFDVLVSETDHDLVKFEVDCGWMVIAGAEPQKYFVQHPGRFRMLHVKDFKPMPPTIALRGPTRPTGVELGHGFIDYKPIFAAARHAGIVHIFAEQEAPYMRSQLESAKVSFEFLNSFNS